MELTELDRASLIHDIANRAAPASELAKRYLATVPELKAFTAANLAEITRLRDESATVDTDANTVTPTQLDQLWISNKFERLRRLEDVADIAYLKITDGYLVGTDFATVIREFRSYMLQAANELGQLLHRGAGDTGSTDTLSVDIQGIDMDALR